MGSHLVAVRGGAGDASDQVNELGLAAWGQAEPSALDPLRALDSGGSNSGDDVYDRAAISTVRGAVRQSAACLKPQMRV
jgi:hypothetical protein